MRVQVNGKPQDLPDAATVLQLLEMLKIGGDGIAVEVNREIIPRSRHDQTPLRDGDAVEIVTFVGGG